MYIDALAVTISAAMNDNGSDSFLAVAFPIARMCWAFRAFNGDGGNRTHVRDRVKMASTSVAGALVSSPARLAGGVAGNQPAECVPGLAQAGRPG
jgi:hypothetical protein